jgi:hypothetical protein
VRGVEAMMKIRMDDDDDDDEDEREGCSVSRP